MARFTTIGARRRNYRGILALGDDEFVQSRRRSRFDGDCRRTCRIRGRCHCRHMYSSHCRRRDHRRSGGRGGGRRAKLAAETLAQKHGVLAQRGAKPQRRFGALDRAVVHAADAFVDDETARDVDAVSRRGTAGGGGGGGSCCRRRRCGTGGGGGSGFGSGFFLGGKDKIEESEPECCAPEISLE